MFDDYNIMDKRAVTLSHDFRQD